MKRKRKSDKVGVINLITAIINLAIVIARLLSEGD